MKLRNLAALAAALTVTAATVSASTLLGTDGDRTVVRDGGFTLTFLDLTITQGDTPAEALQRDETAGFDVATFDQVAALLAAFDVTLPAEPNDSTTTFAATDFQVQAFGDALGFTQPEDRFGNFSTAGLFDGRFDYGTQVRLANTTSPGTPTFISNANDRDGNGSIGVFMVSVEPAAVIPLPASAFLLIGGLGGLVALRRRARR
jgi:hypothetical protein